MKSQATSSLSILHAIYKDACRECGVDPDHRDVKTLISRVKHEGLQFLTVTLPALGADLESALEQGKVDSNLFRSFAKRHKKPAFLGSFFNRVFNESGILLDEPDPQAVSGIRQIAYTFKKPKEVCSDADCAKAYKKFVEVERELANFQVCDSDWREYIDVCRYLWDSTWSSFCIEDLVPKHGPGATAERVNGNAKFLMKRYHERLEPFFPMATFAWPYEHANDTMFAKGMQVVNEDSEQPVRVIAVPKTAKKPRIIAIEPVCMQYTQQAVSQWLVNTLEHGFLTRGHINFKDQSVNQRLALEGSVTRKLSTIDLSDASDRVLNTLVAPMFSSNEDLYGAIMACRSRKAQLNNEVITLSKFASMGSALCFPIEAMVFYTICILGHIRNAQKKISYASVKNAARDIYVYGDDIIAPVDATPVIVSTLEQFALRVNVKKSFVHGNFRESCGCDAFKGVNVTPVYLRRRVPHNKPDVPTLVSYVESANQFAQKGYGETFRRIKTICERYYKIPYTGPNCESLGWHESSSVKPGEFSSVRWNTEHQVTEIRGFVIDVKKKKDVIGGEAALMRWFLMSSVAQPAGQDPVKPELDYMRSVQRGAVTLKRRWVRPY